MALPGGIEVATESARAGTGRRHHRPRPRAHTAVLTTIITSPDDRAFTDRSRVLADKTRSTPSARRRCGQRFLSRLRGQPESDGHRRRPRLRQSRHRHRPAQAASRVGVLERRELAGPRRGQRLHARFNQRGEILIHVPMMQRGRRSTGRTNSGSAAGSSHQPGQPSTRRRAFLA